MLRGKRLCGHKFKRQEQIGDFIVDFVCFANRLIIEADGSRACRLARRMLARTVCAWKGMGFRVLRFWNSDILTNSDGVGTAILAALETPLPNPFSRKGRRA